MELHPKQKEVINSTNKKKLLNWGRRSGKTTAVGYEIFAKLWNTEGGLVSYYAPTYSDARDIAWEMFKEILEPITVKTNETLLEITVNNVHKGTSKLKMYGWESVKNRDKGRGVENDLVVLDEVAFYPMFKEKFEKVIEPTLLTSKGDLIMTSTPNGFNHFYDLYMMASNNKDWFVSHATSYDNPFNPAEELTKLQNEKDEDAFAQEYMADFRKLTGLVYKEFDRFQHTYDDSIEINGKEERLVAIDWGFTNPTAIYCIDRDYDNNFWINTEYYETEKTTDELLEYIGQLKGNKFYPDPAEPDRLEAMRRKGFNVREVSKDILAGIDTVKTLFRNGRLRVHKDCYNLIHELETYRYEEKKADKNDPEKPVKENDHCFVAGTKVITNNGEKNIEDIETGDLVASPFGWNEVIRRGNAGNRDVYDYGAFSCTPNHRIPTQRGLLEVDSLRDSDTIEVWNESFGTEHLIDFTRVRFIIKGLLIKSLATRQVFYTEMYGNTIMGRLKKVFMFTMSMVTALTTTLKILSVLLLANMLKGTSGVFGMVWKSIWTLLGTNQKNGIDQKKVESGTDSTQRSNGLVERFIQRLAKCVNKNIKLHSLQEVSTVIKTVKPKHLGKEDVYNLQTKYGFYYANRVLVGNSMDAIRYALHMGANQAPRTKVSKHFYPSYLR